MAKNRRKKKASRKKPSAARAGKKATGKKSATSRRRSPRKAVKKKSPSISAKPAAATEDVEPLRPEAGEVIVRMYRQGLGDCFLLAFGATDGPRYVLIDCGIHMRQRNGKDRLLQVMRHLVASTDSHIHVVVGTHEHADHLSGFVQKNSPFLKDSLTIDQLWVGWTERIGDPDADRLRKEKATAREIIEKAVAEAMSKNNQRLTAFGEQLRGLMDFETPEKEAFGKPERAAVIAAIKAHTGDDLHESQSYNFMSEFIPRDTGLAAAGARKKKKKPTSNELALGLLSARSEDVEYCDPGQVMSIPGVRGVRAYTLGPPRSDLFLKKDLPSKVRGGHDHEYKETYLSGSVELQSLRRAPALNMSQESSQAADQQHPFTYEYRRKIMASRRKKSDLWGETPKRERATQKFFNTHCFGEQNEWRSIDGDWLAPAEQLALHLDSDTNNTSLALAFELGEPGKGPVLLFPGDAQVGNWLSWREQNYEVDGNTMTADDLLQRTLVYKVGHHGSHNATLKNYVRPKSRDDGEAYGLELMDGIIAMIPVDRDAADRSMPIPWRMPHGPLYKRLRMKADRRVLRSDLSTRPFSDSAARDIVPTSTTWTKVPGKRELSWRRSQEEFSEGTNGPLYYDIRVSVSPQN